MFFMKLSPESPIAALLFTQRWHHPRSVVWETDGKWRTLHAGLVPRHLMRMPTTRVSIPSNHLDRCPATKRSSTPMILSKSSPSGLPYQTWTPVAASYTVDNSACMSHYSIEMNNINVLLLLQSYHQFQRNRTV